METKYPTEFVIWFKVDDGYRMTVINPPSDIDRVFFESLRLRLVVELENIKKDIIRIIPGGDKYAVIRPRVDDESKQEILDNLVKIRKENLKTKRVVDNILSGEDFILCEHCKSKMYRKPVGVSYSKYGQSILIKDSDMNSDIRYIFDCSNPDCHFCIQEEIYQVFLQNKQMREELLHKGETKVPNNFGFWYDIKT